MNVDSEFASSEVLADVDIMSSTGVGAKNKYQLKLDFPAVCILESIEPL